MAKRSAARNTKRSRRTSNIEEMADRNEGQERKTPTRARRSGSSATLSAEERDYKEILRELVSSPAVRYIAGGIATALLTRLANNLSDRYPEISNFIRENMDNLEGRLGEFRNGLEGDGLSSRH